MELNKQGINSSRVRILNKERQILFRGAGNAHATLIVTLIFKQIKAFRTLSSNRHRSDV